MKKSLILLSVFCSFQLLFAEPRMVKMQYGDFEHWTVRYIKESVILGGKTRILYAVAPTDTIRKNGPFRYGVKGNPWSPSNAYAKVSGIEKGSGTVVPEYRDEKNGYCCRLDSKLEEMTALGMIDIKVLVAGTLFTGRTIEPIKTAKDPYQNIDFGVPFTKTPVAVVYDYKAVVKPDQTMTYAKGLGKPKTVSGHDEAEVFCLLQRRWEDEDGNIFAERVATANERFTESQPNWVSNHRLVLHYGDITGMDFYKPYMALQTDFMRAMNSKGKIVPIQEVGYATEGTHPTHIILSFSSGCQEAFVGCDGNTLWIDNIRMLYE